MFYYFKELDKKYLDYISSEKGQINISDGSDTFASIHPLIAHVYGENHRYCFAARWMKDEKKIVFTDSSYADQKKFANKKLAKIHDCAEASLSLIETTENIGHFVKIHQNSIILTDYGPIVFTASYTSGKVTKIFSITAVISDKSKINDIENLINENMSIMPMDGVQKNMGICTSGSYGLNLDMVDVKPFECDIKANYNDDVPYDRITELINSDRQQLILLHGEPGTGKTSLIRKLVYDNPDIQFIYFDFQLLTSVGDSKIFTFLMENKNSVFIIEDCEKLFTDRNSGNRQLNTILNLTDGIIGEAFGIKFICTFNCHTNQLDKAVLREGRLSLIYEFKRLSLEKTKMLDPTATEPETLAKIYHKEDNGRGEMKNPTIGFSA